MKRLTAVVGLTAVAAVVGTSIALAPIASSSESTPEVVSAASDQLPAARGVDAQALAHNLDQRSVPASPEAFEQLVAEAVRQQNPAATAEDIDRVIAALADLGKIIAGVDPADVTRVAAGITEASAAIAEFQATGNPDAARRVLCGSGNAAAGSLSILSDVVRMYEASANLPQIAEVLNLLDPRTPQGAALFEQLPDFAKTEQTKAALISLSDIGRTLNTIDKQAVIGLANDWAEAAAKCDIRTLLELPSLMLRTFEMGREILGILGQSNLGDLGTILAPTQVR